MRARLTKSLLPAFLVAATLAVATDNGSAGATCFGRVATIRATAGQETVGSPGPDVIVGTSGRDVIRGNGGNDLICARGGNDRIYGGSGDDRIRAGAGDDWVKAGSGNDRVWGQKGEDVLRGNSGADRLNGGSGSDVLYGGAGEDVLWGKAGSDTLRGGRAGDELYGGKSADRLYGMSGADLLRGNGGTDTLRGGTGRDLCFRGGDTLSSCNEPKALDAASGACLSGDWQRCDLLKETEHRSDFWWVGETCGGRNRTGMPFACDELHEIPDPRSLGEDPYLDALLVLCDQRTSACKEMRDWAPAGSMWAFEGPPPRQLTYHKAEGMAWATIGAQYDDPESITITSDSTDSYPMCLIHTYVTEGDHDLGWRCTYEKTGSRTYQFTLEAPYAGSGYNIFFPGPPDGYVNALAVVLEEDFFPLPRVEEFTVEGANVVRNLGFSTPTGTVPIIEVLEYDTDAEDRYGFEVEQRSNGNWYVETYDGSSDSRVSGYINFVEREYWNYLCVRDSGRLPQATTYWPSSLVDQIADSDQVDNPIIWTPRDDCGSWPTPPIPDPGWLSFAAISHYEDSREGEVFRTNNDPYYDVDTILRNKDKPSARIILRTYAGRFVDDPIHAELQYITLGAISDPPPEPPTPPPVG